MFKVVKRINGVKESVECLTFSDAALKLKEMMLDHDESAKNYTHLKMAMIIDRRYEQYQDGFIYIEENGDIPFGVTGLDLEDAPYEVFASSVEGTETVDFADTLEEARAIAKVFTQQIKDGVFEDIHNLTIADVTAVKIDRGPDGESYDIEPEEEAPSFVKVRLYRSRTITETIEVEAASAKGAAVNQDLGAYAGEDWEELSEETIEYVNLLHMAHEVD